MFRLILTLTFAALVAAGAARAADTASALGFTSAEIRLSIWNGEAEEYHLWRLRPGGRATGYSSAYYNRGRAYWHEQLSDTGQWSLSGNILCMTWSRLLEGGRHCFRLTVNGTRLKAVSIGRGRTSHGTLHPLAAR